MSFSNLKIRTYLRKEAVKRYKTSTTKNKQGSEFKSGYNKGFGDCLRWVMRIFQVHNVKDLKLLTPDQSKNI